MAMDLKTTSMIVGMMASLALLATSALAQQPSQVGAIVTVKLTDPDDPDDAWRVQRQLLRTWATMQSCENQKQAFVDYHLGEVQGYGLVTPSGKSPLVEIEKIECFSIRE
jgi:hypothetical protein